MHRIKYSIPLWDVYIFLAAFESGQQENTYLGGIVMKLVISLLSVILVLIVLGTLFGALSDMFSAYLNDLLTVGLGV